MPLIIYRYLILEILPPFWVGLLAFTSIVFLGRLMKITQMIVVKGVGLVEVLQTCLFLLALPAGLYPAHGGHRRNLAVPDPPHRGS